MLDFEGRQAVASSTGQRAVLSAFKHSVVVVDLQTGVFSRTLETTFDAGGDRLALSDQLDALVAAAYHVHGLALYCCKTGEERWRRKDLKKVQRISLSRDGLSAYCGREGAPLAVVDLRSGETTRSVRGARALDDSKFEPLQFVDAFYPHLLHDGKRKLLVDRTTFAFLDICSGVGLLVLSEAGGPLRCIDTASGRERWRYQPRTGCHVLHLGYQETEPCLLGVEWPYVGGGSKRVIRWSPSDGTVIDSMILGEPADCCFGLAGQVIVLSDGRIIRTLSTNGSVREGA